jgi:hypothetical protein
LPRQGFIEVTQLCPSQIQNSSCNGGNLPGIQQHTYVGTFTFPTSCTNFTIRYDLNARNASVTNLQNLASSGVTFEGLKAGDTLITTGTQFVKPGSELNIVTLANAI